MLKEKIKNVWRFMYIAVLVHFLSLLLTGIGVFATLFASHTKRDVSTTLSAGIYLILTATAGPYVVFQPGFIGKLKQCWWKFLIIGFADFYSIYLQTLAFNYTSISSTQGITSSFYTLLVIILGLFTAQTRYIVIHYIFIAITISSGIVIVAWQDLDESDNSENRLIGDALSLASGFLTVFATVSKSFLIKESLDITEFISLLGFSGAVISSIQLYVLDEKDLAEIEWNSTAVLYFLGYHLCCYCYYTLVIVKSSSVITNLSCVTANIYSLIFAILLFNNNFSVFYIGGFMIIMFGLVLFTIIPTPPGDTDQSVFSTGFWYKYGHALFTGTCTNSDDELLDKWLSDVDDCYILAQQTLGEHCISYVSLLIPVLIIMIMRYFVMDEETTRWRMSIKAAGDPDLDIVLDNLHKVKEETAVATSVHDTRPPTAAASENLQMTGKEFDHLLQTLQFSDVVHVPTSLTIHDSVKLCRNKSFPSELSILGSAYRHRKYSFPLQYYDGGPRPSSVTSPCSLSQEKLHKHLRLFAQQVKVDEVDETSTPAEEERKQETEEIISNKETRITKLMMVKVIHGNGFSKMIVIYEHMNAYDVCVMLAEKYHEKFEPNWTLVERLEDFGLALERTFEDHENVAEKLSHWPKVHHNTLHFRYNPDKYQLLTEPQMLVPNSHALSATRKTSYFSDETRRKILINEIFVDGFIPLTEGKLFYKDDQQTNWKKYQFYIKTVGLYMCKSGQTWLTTNLDLVVMWSDVCVYKCTAEFRKYYKAPSDLCFSLVPKGPIERIHDSIKYFCLPINGKKQNLDMWIAGIRIVTYGKQLVIDHEVSEEKFKQLQKLSEEREYQIEEDSYASTEETREETKEYQEGTTEAVNSGFGSSIDLELRALQDNLVALKTNIAKASATVIAESKCDSSVDVNSSTSLSSRSLSTLSSYDSQEKDIDDVGSEEQFSSSETLKAQPFSICNTETEEHK